ncbi:hypothetical protein ATN88_08120 [Enterovibrio coralii]|uniref:Uncharacterized protein n=1 Tax=Enterovibrio coralii TaxID=294935 RepID=A0A135I5D9_9GAMM|nr:hypothetical protein ATN88_08120 [Enterovibrio coralii]
MRIIWSGVMLRDCGWQGCKALADADSSYVGELARIIGRGKGTRNIMAIMRTIVISLCNNDKWGYLKLIFSVTLYLTTE